MQEIEQHIVNMSDEILHVRSLLAGLMEVMRLLVMLRPGSKFLVLAVYQDASE